jgi:hypothetical protein
LQVAQDCIGTQGHPGCFMSNKSWKRKKEILKNSTMFFTPYRVLHTILQALKTCGQRSLFFFFWHWACFGRTHIIAHSWPTNYTKASTKQKDREKKTGDHSPKVKKKWKVSKQSKTKLEYIINRYPCI